ncbi:hypothetical protein AAW12_08595 [Sphingobacterium sp. Ag1]|uniref:hypothetical protein n=1 Tax=Sphingobacterium sp. Ag1 TaxID=1643451 RepID=UPI0006280A35|nr:hypothetical protein [Sphingobacterium sp. Ag1]KKO91716.1 hypothetical protein AAW12_08595 [Sphingobacterium sp. Ag1]
MDREQILEAFKSAKLAANEAAEQTKDVGPINMDTVVFKVDGWRRREYRWLQLHSQVSFGEPMKGVFSGYRFAFFQTDSVNANARTAAQSAAEKVLKEAGISATIWYQLD